MTYILLLLASILPAFRHLNEPGRLAESQIRLFESTCYKSWCSPEHLSKGLDELQEFNCEISFDIVKKEGFYTFEIRAKTNLPENALVKVSIQYYYREDSTEGLVDYSTRYVPAKVQEGKLSLEAYKFQKKPFSGKYMARIDIDESEQDDKDVRTKLMGLKDGKLSFKKDRSFGSDSDYRKEIKASAKSLHIDFKEIRLFLLEIKDKFIKYQAKPDEKAWNDLTVKTKEKMSKITEANKIRLEYGFDTEKYGKGAINEMGKMLTEIMQISTEALKEKGEKVTTARTKMDEFLKYYDMEVEALGVDAPEPELVKPLVDALEELVKSLSEGKGDSHTLKVKATHILVKLSELATMKGYYYLVRIQETLNEAFEDKTKIDKVKEAISQFKSFADIK